MERAGISLKSKLFSTNPWSKEGCVRTGCFPCLPGEGGDCRRDSLVYYMQCNSCLQQGEGEGWARGRGEAGEGEGRTTRSFC